MTRKDYILIAAAVHTAIKFCEDNGDSTVCAVTVAECLAADLKSTKPAFRFGPLYECVQVWSEIIC